MYPHGMHKGRVHGNRMQCAWAMHVGITQDMHVSSDSCPVGVSADSCPVGAP